MELTVPREVRGGTAVGLAAAEAQGKEPKLPRAVRGYTAVGLAEAAAEERQAELQVKVSDNLQVCDEVNGACTVVSVRSTDRPGLLANISAVLAGIDLTVARAVFSTSEDGVVSNDFWVQEPGADGLGPVLERHKRRSIEQRLRQWSAGIETQELDGSSAGLRESKRRNSNDGSGELPRWANTVLLEPHKDTEGEGAAPLVHALADALSTPNLSWLGVLPPVLARRTAIALLPRMTRLSIAAGGRIECDDEHLLLLEDRLPVACVTDPRGRTDVEPSNGDGRVALAACQE
eukprot:1654990-Prymnesium_polylepis.1